MTKGYTFSAKAREIAALYETGDFTQQDIGARLGITGTRVGQILRKWKEECRLEELRRSTTETAAAGPTSIADLPVEGLAISNRSRNCLMHANIKTVGQLCSLAPAELVRSKYKPRYFGRWCLDDVRAALDRIGAPHLLGENRRNAAKAQWAKKKP